MVAKVDPHSIQLSASANLRFLVTRCGRSYEAQKSMQAHTAIRMQRTCIVKASAEQSFRIRQKINANTLDKRAAFALHLFSRLLELLHDIFLQTDLIGLDVSLPRCDCFLVADPDLFGHLADKTEVVADKNQTTSEVVDSPG